MSKTHGSELQANTHQILCKVVSYSQHHEPIWFQSISQAQLQCIAQKWLPSKGEFSEKLMKLKLQAPSLAPAASKALEGPQQCVTWLYYFCKICKSNTFQLNWLELLFPLSLPQPCPLVTSHFSCQVATSIFGEVELGRYIQVGSSMTYLCNSQSLLCMVNLFPLQYRNRFYKYSYHPCS